MVRYRLQRASDSGVRMNRYSPATSGYFAFDPPPPPHNNLKKQSCQHVIIMIYSRASQLPISSLKPFTLIRIIVITSSHWHGLPSFHNPNHHVQPCGRHHPLQPNDCATLWQTGNPLWLEAFQFRLASCELQSDGQQKLVHRLTKRCNSAGRIIAPMVKNAGQRKETIIVVLVGGCR